MFSYSVALQLLLIAANNPPLPHQRAINDDFISVRVEKTQQFAFHRATVSGGWQQHQWKKACECVLLQFDQHSRSTPLPLSGASRTLQSRKSIKAAFDRR
jgi:hypothetical protein